MSLEDRAHRGEATFGVDRRRRNIGDNINTRNILQRLAESDKARRQKLQTVVRQQYHFRLFEMGADISGCGISQCLARQILRGVQQGRRRRRHNRTDIAAAPHHFLQAWSERQGIDGGGNHRTDAGLAKGADLVGVFCCVIGGKRHRIGEAAIAGGHGEAMVHALHEFAFVVLGKAEGFFQSGRRAAGGDVRVELRKDHRAGDARALGFGPHSGQTDRRQNGEGRQPKAVVRPVDRVRHSNP
jgi:hypothetical protein